ncbi:cold-regulated 413 plasma membrane protein 2 isoform X3 [Cryptomeria japonica]|uniref:cold-regulated 413 plasma membrane protein 2 isoform X3 n=1 Tax=Cryptomeria japonica TaxID=3369 RepID=UPI0027DA215E|nr:cold-regulated 413 plasma membrane protein 2 isoform X3 [Cryptomeria japonica]
MTLANGNDSSSAVQAAALFDASDHDATFPRYLAIAAALYLLASHKENWRHVNIGIMPLVAFIVLNSPSILFNIIWKDFGKWITFLFVTLHLFFRQYILAGG